MNNEVSRFIDSGLLEMYVLGDTSPEQNELVEQLAKEHIEIREELYSIEVALENYAINQAAPVDPTIKPFLMATVDYMQRISNGEPVSFPLQITAGSIISDYDDWLNRADLQLTEPLDEIAAHIIGSTPELTMAIVWIKNGAPPEIHRKELETFLIVEGTCNIVVEGKDNHLSSGDIFTIPLHLSHHVQVTSLIPCKLILQRLVA